MHNAAMRRFYPSLVLALLLATPLLHLRCAIARAMPETSASAGRCEHERATAPEATRTLASHHDCGEHAASAAVVLTNRLLHLDALPAARVSSIGAVATRLFTAIPVAVSLGGPPGVLLVPLRV